MKREFKLNSDLRHHSEQIAQSSGPLEFASPDEMLRHDALHTPVPPGIETKVRDSAASLQPRRSWWRRLFRQP